MRYFLDMNIPIYFCFQFGHLLEKKAKFFVKNKGANNFLLCDYILSRNIPRWIKRQKIILYEFNQKIQNSSYLLFSSEGSKDLFSKDKLFVKKLIQLHSISKDKKQFSKKINSIFNLLDKKIKSFIISFIDEIVIPEKEIDFDLKSCLRTWLSNDSDCFTIASGIQEHQKKKLILFTADKKDWTTELLEEIHRDPQLIKKYRDLPKIECLQNYSPK